LSSNLFKDKVILVTGAAGSIGREIVAQLLEFEPKVVRALDTNETGLFYLEQTFGLKRLRPLIGDVRDSKRLNLALEDVDIVFHAAALKHVPLCENNPFEAIKTNSVGTQNLIQAARNHNVKKFITISTDKAINPTNVMGATKLLAERLTIAANLYVGQRDISFSVVRFGNVLGSRGSIIPLFVRQIQGGEPVTVTDPKMTRFYMKTEEAVRLVLEAATISKGGEIFVLEMAVIHLKDLVEQIIEEFAPKFGYSPDDIKLKEIGKRPGEKDYEELLSNYEVETSYVYRKGNLYIAIPKNPDYYPKRLCDYYEKLGATQIHEYDSNLFSSDDAKILTKSQIKHVIQELSEKMLEVGFSTD
jgi:FlaA1/EpsC-like NDP-sugar epimerase